jgi:hypothetical protein
VLPPLGREQSYGRLEVPPPDDPAYRRWLPAPSTFANDSNYAFAYREPAPVDGGEPEELLGRRAMSRSSGTGTPRVVPRWTSTRGPDRRP